MRLPRRRSTGLDAPNVDVTAFLSLMVILVPFLMITAVFSRMTIVELDATASQRVAKTSQDPLELRIWVREQVLEIHHRGQGAPLSLSRTPDGQEHEQLAELAMKLKSQYPEITQATLLLEPQIPYDELVRIMDVVRVRQIHGSEAAPIQIDLFPRITLGETSVVEAVGPQAQ